MKVIKNKWFRLGLYVLGYFSIILLIVSAVVSGFRYGIFMDETSFDKPYEESVNVQNGVFADLKQVQKKAYIKNIANKIDLDSKKFEFYDYSAVKDNDGKEELSPSTNSVNDLFEDDVTNRLSGYVDDNSGEGSIWNGYAKQIKLSDDRFIRLTWSEYQSIAADYCIKYSDDYDPEDKEYEFLWNNIQGLDIGEGDYFKNINDKLYLYSINSDYIYYSPNGYLQLVSFSEPSDYLYIQYDDVIEDYLKNGKEGKKQIEEYILTSMIMRNNTELLYTCLSEEEKQCLQIEDYHEYMVYTADYGFSFGDDKLNSSEEEESYSKFLNTSKENAVIFVSYDAKKKEVEQWYKNKTGEKVDFDYISEDELEELTNICDESFVYSIKNKTVNDQFLIEGVAFRVCSNYKYPVWGCVISGIIFCICVVLLIIGEPAKLFFVDKAPYIVWGFVYVMLLGASFSLFAVTGITSLVADLMSKEMGALVLACLFAILIFYIATAGVVMNVVRRIKCKEFFDGFVIVILFKYIFGGYKGISKNIAGKLRLVVVLVFLLAINIITLLAFAASLYDESILAAVLIAVIDIAGAGLMLKRGMDMDKLLETSRKIENGEFDAKVNVDELRLDTRELGQSLNNLGDSLSKAVEASLRDERTKAELITNVSHDIKTPLTSIINYVDLLKKEDIDNEKAKEYIDVLDQKSERLKQLILDLIEASKTSTGNVELELMNINFVELINQCMGEHEDKFKENNLVVVKDFKTDNALINADGRRVYRIIDNIMNNVAKYAKPDTRVYMDIDIINQEQPEKDNVDGENIPGSVIFSIKNVSKEMLNITPEELSERFVRGDRSRNTEGSGLGLSIAKNLTELQKGTFDISIDGDLFRVNVSFPLVENNVN